MNTPQRGFIVPLFFIIIALFLAGGAYVYMQKKQPHTPPITSLPTQATPTTESLPIAATSNSQTSERIYSDTKYGFSFQYPSEYQVYSRAVPEPFDITIANTLSPASKNPKDLFLAKTGMEGKWFNEALLHIQIGDGVATGNTLDVFETTTKQAYEDDFASGNTKSIPQFIEITTDSGEKGFKLVDPPTNLTFAAYFIKDSLFINIERVSHEDSDIVEKVLRSFVLTNY